LFPFDLAHSLSVSSAIELYHWNIYSPRTLWHFPQKTFDLFHWSSYNCSSGTGGVLVKRSDNIRVPADLAAMLRVIAWNRGLALSELADQLLRDKATKLSIGLPADTPRRLRPGRKRKQLAAG
jgi:hypothetical protein